ncbi:ABC transporter permease subunit [candidate division KSB3 bacterium]|jgi:putative spermidine/putrescine transport system permease protein|uniref:ABC transporter permease subunit n=1 Tax=candidate division KSB3 bacterium TaxID=2044937 RepID=A0A9D5Q850_9BACT|nr:ABC transporter permease subunit [candidate division KSB3 bacterium]MBD3327103.1 ABC transporter permease subunit [candidate division KSB3 bacterium]
MHLNIRHAIKRTHSVFIVITLLDFIFLGLPTLIILLGSFTSGNIIAFPPEGFSLQWYVKLLEPTMRVFRMAFVRSFYVALFCTLISIPVGVFAALALNKYSIRGKNIFQTYFLLPFTIPLIVSGVGLMIIYGHLNWLDKVWPIGLALTIINLPFMLWAVSSSVNALDRNLEDAAQNLGADEIQTFWYVTLPALMPGVITGSLLMFMLGFNEFVVSLLLVSTRNMTLPVALYSSIRTQISPALAAVSSVYIVIAVFAIWVLDRAVGLKEFLRSR